jgi:hypothetical protein
MLRAPLVLAFWQFGSAWMLLWGLAAALPILIHLWSRRRFREESWAAMQFLLAAMRKNARRIQVQQWLLLAVRTAILALLALALADPQLSLLPGWTGAAASGQTHVMLVIDGSYSMDYRQDDKSRFDIARELARQMVSDGKQGNGYTLVLMGQPPKVVIAQPAFDPQDVIEEIDSLSLLHAGASLPATLAEIETLLHRASQIQPRLVQRQVVFFTDLQQQTWSEVASADCRDRLARMESLATVSLIDLGEPGSANLAVARLEAGQALVTRGSEVTLSAEIQSFSRQDLPRQAIELLVNGQRIADERVDVPAAGRVRVAATYRFQSAGEHVVEAHLADDSLALDNRRWLALPVREAVRVLAIAGRPGEARHVALALNPRPRERGSIEVTEAAESALLETDLAAYDCIVLCNVGRFSRDEAALLRAYLERGGGLIFFLGDQVQPASYNEQLAQDDPKLRVLPARLGDVAREAQYRLNPLDYGHAIVSPFRGHEASGLLTTPIWRYVRLAPFADAKVALGFDGGDAALVEQRIGRGWSILCATAASSESLDRSTNPPTPWTALSSWPSFPPLVHEMLHLAVSGRAAGRNVLVGDDLSGVANTADGRAELTRPDGSSQRLALVQDGPDTRWTYSDAMASGVYSAHAGSLEQKFAVNLNPRESDLARLDPDLLPSQFDRGPTEGADPTPAVAGREGTSYFRWLLSLVLVLVLCEPCLAWYFGRGRG